MEGVYVWFLLHRIDLYAMCLDEGEMQLGRGKLCVAV